MITTAAYPDYANNPPGISFMGKKTWKPGKYLQTFIAGVFGVPVREQAQIVERIAEAMIDIGPHVRLAMERYPGFRDIGKRMLLCWGEGMASLYDKKTYSLGTPELGEAFMGMSDHESGKQERLPIGRSDLLPRR
ncbi:MAG: hypothetical protein GAK28_03641 [Luteibacter sp.]|nr:MAG: hypothetical protein GAK28_03641 [Luteibacter sp.]